MAAIDDDDDDDDRESKGRESDLRTPPRTPWRIKFRAERERKNGNQLRRSLMSSIRCNFFSSSLIMPRELALWGFVS